MKPTPIIAVDEPAKGLRIQGQSMRKPTTSDRFWSSSPCDQDNSTIQSQRSISSVSTLNQILHQSNGTSTAGTDPEFVNQGKSYFGFLFFFLAISIGMLIYIFSIAHEPFVFYALESPRDQHRRGKLDKWGIKSPSHPVQSRDQCFLLSCWRMGRDNFYLVCFCFII